MTTKLPALLFRLSKTVLRGRLVAACACAVLLVGGGQARAQWGWGGGWGWGGMGGGELSNMATLNNINQRSSAAANYAYSIRQNIPGTGNVYAHSPNSYMNSMRDASFYQTFDVSTRRSSGASAARTPTRRATSTAAAAAPAIPPLQQFFSAAGKLVWPAESPTSGVLGDKKGLADQSAESVYREVKGRGFAPVGLVTDARTRLVDYGQPALEYLTQHASTSAVDAFHQFLLSLYDSLGAAGTQRR